MSKVYLSLGTNIGQKQKNLFQSIEYIKSKKISICSTSNIYETEPWGYQTQEKFYNMCIEIQSTKSPFELLFFFKDVEKRMGREQRLSTLYEDRIIDIDILFFDNLVLETQQLTIPHNLLHKRNFVLAPLCEIAPDFIHPIFKKTIKELYNSSKDDTKIKIISCEKIYCNN